MFKTTAPRIKLARLIDTNNNNDNNNNHLLREH